MNSKPTKGWIGVDLDGTLAKYTDWAGPNVIGEPIPVMMTRVQQWVRAGKTVKIFSARAGRGQQAIDAIRSWCVKNGLPPLEVTNIKDPSCEAIFDDKAWRVETNTGRILSVGSPS